MNCFYVLSWNGIRAVEHHLLEWELRWHKYRLHIEVSISKVSSKLGWKYIYDTKGYVSSTIRLCCRIVGIQMNTQFQPPNSNSEYQPKYIISTDIRVNSYSKLKKKIPITS